MWTDENRRLYERRGPRYPSDLSDAEWALIAPLIPPAKHGGRKREVDVREVMNGVLYVLETGCQWRALPKDLPPKSTVHDYLMLWDWDGTLERVHHALYLMTRELEGREASPSAGVIDSQSVKGAGKRGARIDRPGYDAGKKIKGKKRHLLVDTIGLILNVAVHAADLQDRDGAVLVLDRRTRRLFPFLEKIFADGAYGGDKLRKAMAGAAWTIEVVKRSDTAKGFEPIPKRWVVERTIAWINRCRRLAKDYENLNRTALAFVRLASIRLMLRRLTRFCYPS
ncbi:MAG: IS5 family transposase [SAR202 cluster bacterium]|nr:IS5 family transposase [SAR202 cluster bacterium]